MFGRGASVQHCGGCGRGIPAGHAKCGHCSAAGRVTSKTRSRKLGPRRCGARLENGGTCGGTVPGGGRCDRCQKS